MSDIPKFIKEAPWYNAQEGTAHQQKDPEQVRDYSEATAGAGMQDGWDAKRDRWNGYADDWVDTAKNWHYDDADESDGTTYELEMEELGLSAQNVKSTVKQHAMEKTIRDRADVPEYIRRIGNKAKPKP